MNAMQHRLLSRFHRVFDQAPDGALALRVRGADGLRWRVEGDMLSIFRPPLPDLEISLAGKTIGDIRSVLLAAGCEIPYADVATLETGALALLEGEGDQDASNGDHLRIYTSLLWNWADAVGRALADAKISIGEMLRQLVIRQSSDEWTDLWGSYFGVLRRAGESDEHLAQRIVFEPRRPRSNPLAIISNIKRETGHLIDVREPWREMAVVGEFMASGEHVIADGREFSYHFMQLVSRDFLDWTVPMREAEADRPAGTLYLPPVTHPAPWFVTPASGRSVGFGGADVHSWLVRDYDGHIIGWNFYPSDSYVRMNPWFAIYDLLTFKTGGLNNPANIANHTTFCRGEWIVSEQGPLDDEQARIPGRKRVEYGEPLVASVSGPVSDYTWDLRWEPVDEWVAEERQLGLADALVRPAARDVRVVHVVSLPVAPATAAVQDVLGLVDVFALTIPHLFGAGWSGEWDDRTWSSGSFFDPVSHGFSVATLTKVPLLDGDGEQITDQDGNPLFIEVST